MGSEEKRLKTIKSMVNSSQVSLADQLNTATEQWMAAKRQAVLIITLHQVY
jgi:hypothetical protein